MLKKLEIKLSKFKKIQRPKEKLEQYNTPERLAIESIIFIGEEIKELLRKNKIKVLDACAGTAYLGLAFLLFLEELSYKGEVEISFVEKDKDLIKDLESNIKEFLNKSSLKISYKIINKDCLDFNERFFDLILMNPPFGIKQRIKDVQFVKKMLGLKNKDAYLLSFHKAETLDYLRKRFKIKKYFITDFEIKKQFWYHKKKRENVKVVIVLFE